jgi:diguanylate cyclase (GGDEF)-like protein
MDPEPDLHAAIEAGGFGFLLLDAAGEVLSADAAAGQLLERETHELLGTPLGQLVHPDDRGWSSEELGRLLEGSMSQLCQEVRLLARGRPEGTWAELHVRALGAGAAPSARAVVMLDAGGDRVLRERELRRLADTDPLTGLYNRRRLSAELARHGALTRRYGTPASLLMIDIDGLKRVNDTHGHSRGDEAIKALSELMGMHLRETDVVARIGGDEFAVLLPQTGLEQAALVAQTLVEQVAGALGAGPWGELTVSIGVADLGGGGGPEEVLERADVAMYEAKRGGGNRHALSGGVGVDAAAPGPPGNGRIELESVLQAVAELGAASRSLVAWELCAEERDVADAWATAVRERLLQRAGRDHLQQEWVYELTHAGHARRAQRDAAG